MITEALKFGLTIIGGLILSAGAFAFLYMFMLVVYMADPTL